MKILPEGQANGGDTEYLEGLLVEFNLGKGAARSDISKITSTRPADQFQRIIIDQEILKEEFVQLHEAFLG